MSLPAETITSVTDPVLEAEARFVREATSMRWRPEQVGQPLLDFLEASGEPTDPLNPVYNIDNYGDFERGKLPHESIAVVPFVVALGGLNFSRKLVTPERFAEIAQTFHDNFDVFRNMDNPRMYETTKATKQALRVIELYGYNHYMGTDEGAREVIRKSGFFVRSDLRTVLR